MEITMQYFPLPPLVKIHNLQDDQEYHKTVPCMIPLFFFTSPLFQVRKGYGVVTLQDAKMKTVVIAKTNQSMVEAESPVSNINARI